MADLTKAELADRVLEHLGILAAGQTASAEDSALVEESIDAAWERLRKLGLAPFATSAIPPWAQTLLRDYVAGDVSRSFGFGDTHKPGQHAAEMELRRQVAGFRHAIPIYSRYF